ncbi:MAG: discoidin domain-containing protein, partial [Rhodospirillales bacterium]
GLFRQYAASKIKLIECSSQNTNIEDGRGLNAFDGNPQSSWHSQWSGARPTHPHHVTVELESSIELNGFSYLPRVDGRPGGVVDKFEVHASLDNKTWTLAKKGRFENILQNRGIHRIAFEQPVKARYFKFTSISAINDDLYGGAAEIGLLSKNADEDIKKLLLASIEADQKDALLPLLSEKATAISSDLNTVKASVEGLALLGDSKTILSVVKNNEKARSHSLAQLVSCDLNQALAYARNWAPTITSQNDFTLFFAAVSKQENGIQKMVENFKSITFSDQNKLAARHAVGRIGLESNELITLFGDNAKDSVGLIEYDKAWLDSFVKSVGKGNAQKGKTLYDTKLAACASCHQIGNIGGKLGPPLTSIGTGMTTSLIVESVLWPDRQVKEGYESAVISLHSGKTILGNIVHENKNEVTIKEVATETEHVVKTSQIKSFKKTGSIMPKGMVAHLTKEELRDLLKYLGELKGVGYK